MTEDKGWHLDKRVPLALLLVLLGQLLVGAYVAGGLQRQVDTLERDVVSVERQIELMRESTQVQAVQLGRIEETLVGLRGDLRDILTREREAQ